MEVGIYIRDFLEDPDRSIYEQIEEAAEVCRRARSWGFSVIYLPQHFIATLLYGCSPCKPWLDWRQMRQA